MMRLLLPLFAALAITASCLAQTLVTYDFTGAPGDQGVHNPSFVANGLSGSGLTRGPGITATDAGGSISSAGWTESAFLDPSDYYTFTITPNAGVTFSIEALSFNERRSGTGIRNWDIRSSLDGFTSSLATGPFSVPDDTNTRSVSLTFSGLTGLTSAIEFRIFGYGAEGNLGTWRLSNSNDLPMTLTGSAIPEPSTYGLMLGLGALGVAGFRRYRERRARAQLQT